MTTTGHPGGLAGADAAALRTLRVDHVGSLLRPGPLRRAFAAYDDGSGSLEELQRAQDVAVRDVIARQIEIGLPVVTDGEFRRRHFNESFGDVAGFDGGGLTPIAMSRRVKRDDDTMAVETVMRAAVQRLSLVRSRPQAEWEAAQAVSRVPAKVTMINPDGVLQRFDAENTPTSVYADDEAFLADVIAIQRRIIAGLVQAGCRYIQIDAPRYGTYLDERWREGMRERGIDPDARLRRAVAAENEIIKGFEDQVTFGLHICRGNAFGQGHHRGGYDRIAEALLEVRHHRLLLEYDSEEAGSFAPLDGLRPSTVVVLGLISSKRGELESAGDLTRRIEAAAQHVPLEQLALSPQCGFATVMTGSPMTDEIQWRKLELMLEVAGDVWGGAEGMSVSDFDEVR